MNFKSKMDIRILTLKKNSYLNTTDVDEEFTQKTETYITAHYFDYFEFKKVNYNDKYPSNFMGKAYKTISDIRKASKNTDTRIQQCIILMQYIKCEGDEKLLKSFWNNKASHIFVTMIKISNGDFSKLSKAKEKILQIITKYGRRNFSIYYTFDFSDIILLSKNISEDIYQNILWDINYNNFETGNNEHKKIINDSVTLYGINYECYKKITREIDNPITNNRLPETFNEKRYKHLLHNKIDVSISIGVQDQTLLMPLKKYLDNSIGKNSYRIDVLFGRRDIIVSLINIEVINVIIIYNKLKTISKRIDNTNQVFLGIKIISSVHESEYIKQCIKKSDQQYKDNHEDKLPFLENLNSNVKRMMLKYEEKSNKISFMDVTEIYHAILELSKSFFSEEFLISIYYSFYAFLKICIENIRKLNKNDNDYYDKYNRICAFQRDYFSCINTLSHCTMHGEKCFIQAAPFNPLLIDIPPKILAFYTAIAYKIKSILKDETNSHQLFSFIFIPDFKASIHVTPISFGPDEDNKLIAVYIHENMLYNPYMVVCTMIHEIAHFVGDAARNREKRLNILILSVIELLMYMRLPKKGVFNLARIISAKIISNIKQSMENDKHSVCYITYINEYLNKSKYLLNDIKKIDPNELDIEDQCKETTINLTDYLDESDSLYDYFNYQLSISENTQAVQATVYKTMWNNIFNSYTYEKLNNYPNSVEQIINSYKEAYSDLVLCALSDISLPEYIDIINKEKTVNLDANRINMRYLLDRINKNKINIQLFLRIASVTSVCFGIVLGDDATDDIDSIIYSRLIMNLVEYLTICKEPIYENKARLKETLSHLKQISNEEDFGFIYNETIDYKEEVIKEIDKDIEL